jgi:hypothetical protein
MKEDCPDCFGKGNAPLLGVGMEILDTGSDEANDIRAKSQKIGRIMVD